MKIERFLGFTDDVKEPQKTKLENMLKKCYRYNGIIYNIVEFLCVKLLEGCYPEKEDNVWHYKRNGEKSKPKTVYKYMNADNRAYFELNKTQYDFVCYLLEHDLVTKDSIEAYDKADVEKTEAIKRAKEVEKIAIEKKAQEYKKEKERIEQMMYDEVDKLPAEEKELMDKIFLSMIGREANMHVYALACFIHHYDNQHCKEAVISRLSNNDNKASIKIFECLTGLKLPKGQKARIDFLKGITSADFKEKMDYKPRKKANSAQEEEFYISEQRAEGLCWVKVLGEPMEKHGVDMFIRRENGIYTVSLAHSGMKIVNGNTKQECTEKLKEIINYNGVTAFKEKANHATEYIVKLIGTNPKYAC